MKIFSFFERERKRYNSKNRKIQSHKSLSRLCPLNKLRVDKQS